MFALYPPYHACRIICLSKYLNTIALAISFLKNKSEFDELTAFENRIDHLSLLAFDLYVGCREKIYEIKANEVKRKYFKLLDRSGFIDPERADGK